VEIAVGYPKDKDTEMDLVLNCTSLGLAKGDALPLDTDLFSLDKTRAVYDMIYQPAETPLLAAARAANCQTANGLGMLLHQGAKALEIWSGQTAPLKVMRAALEEAVNG
jgi:shikimate dehydrogenase